jgi:hypothetical protein
MNFRPHDATGWFITQAVQRVESEAASQAARIRYAKTIEEVVRSADVSVPAEVRFMRNSIRGLRSLESAAERRIEELLKPRLEEITAATTSTEAKALRGRLLQDCGRLRGNFPRQYGHAFRESDRLVYLKVRSEKPAEEGPNVPPAA